MIINFEEIKLVAIALSFGHRQTQIHVKFITIVRVYLQMLRSNIYAYLVYMPLLFSHQASPLFFSYWTPNHHHHHHHHNTHTCDNLNDIGLMCINLHHKYIKNANCFPQLVALKQIIHFDSKHRLLHSLIFFYHLNTFICNNPRTIMSNIRSNGSVKTNSTTTTTTKPIQMASYRSYTNFLSQYSNKKPKDTTKTSEPVPVHAVPVASNKPLQMTTSPPPPPPPAQPKCESNSIKLDHKPPNNSIQGMTIESLLAMPIEEIQLLDIELLKKFLQILNYQNSNDAKNGQTLDSNNNENNENNHHPLTDEEIEQSKLSLIETLKIQLQRLRHN